VVTKKLTGSYRVGPAELKHVRTWTKADAIKGAVSAVLDQGESKLRAQQLYGVSRRTIQQRCEEEIKRRQALNPDYRPPDLPAGGWAKKEPAPQVDEFHNLQLVPKLAVVPDVVDELDEWEELEELEKELDEDTAGAYVGPTVTNERRRVPVGDEFDRIYFNGLSDCPDCLVHHDSPPFHSEMRRAMNDPDIKRLGFNLPPYHAKSTVITIRNTVERIAQNPNYRRIIVSKSIDFARTLMVGIQDLLTNSELYANCERNLIDDWGPFRTGEKGERWNQSAMYVAGRTSAQKDPTVIALGVGGQIYGRRADDIVFDDIATVANQSNPENVVKMLEWIDKEALSRIGKAGKAGWVGTRVHGGDIYSHLAKRVGYTWVRYPLIIDDEQQLTLWPEHFPYEQAMVHRGEMSARDFALVYMNHELPGFGASFTPENVEPCFDHLRGVGQFDPKWRLIAGLDPAGGGAGGGVTSALLYGVDLETGMRFIVDHQATQGMRAPELKALIFDWSDRYPIYAWRVENNAVQSNLVQFNEDITRPLAQRGTRVEGHVTTSNKWDPQVGVESIAPLFSSGMISIPWANEPSRRIMQPLIDELYTFPIGVKQDRVMSLWFAELGVRDILRRAAMPLFDQRTDRWPNRIKRNRRIVDFAEGKVERVGLHDQLPTRVLRNRRVVGRLTGHGTPMPLQPIKTPLINVAGYVEGDDLA